MEAPAQTAVPALAAPLTARAAVAWGVGIGLAGLVAWAVPLSSIVLVWPILFVIPGWIVVRRVAPDLSPPGSLGVAVVTSTYVSAHLVDVVARVTGFGRPAVIVSAVALAVFSVAFATIRLRWLAPFDRPTIAEREARAPRLPPGVDRRWRGRR